MLKAAAAYTLRGGFSYQMNSYRLHSSKILASYQLVYADIK